MNWIMSEIYVLSISKIVVKRIKKQDNKLYFKNKLAIACISKNEAPYLKEWMEYHLLIGIDRIFFYDNESDDNTFEVLKPYIDKGLIEYQTISGIGKQLDAYNDALRNHRYDTKYIAFIDMDEYIMPIDSDKTVFEIIDSLINEKTWAGGIGLNWCCYGSSGHKRRPQGLIIENYTHIAKISHSDNAHIKTICNPRLVKRVVSPHFVQYKLGAFAINETNLSKLWGWFADPRQYKHIRLNHYMVKSEEDFMIKKSRGLGDRAGSIDMTYFYKHDFKDEEDKSMFVYVDKLSRRLFN